MLEEVHLYISSFTSPLDFKSLESLSVLSVVGTEITAFPSLPESIRVLSLDGNENIQWSMQEIAASPLPNLETLKVGWCQRIKNEHVLAILAPSLEKCSLRYLSLDACHSLDFHSIEWLVKHGKNLEKLVIRESRAITDEALKEVMKFNMLRYLDVTHCDISPNGLMNVLNGSLGALREVAISCCLGNDTDATRLAVKSGVKITPRGYY